MKCNQNSPLHFIQIVVHIVLSYTVNVRDCTTMIPCGGDTHGPDSLESPKSLSCYMMGSRNNIMVQKRFLATSSLLCCHTANSSSFCHDWRVKNKKNKKKGPDLWQFSPIKSTSREAEHLISFYVFKHRPHWATDWFCSLVRDCQAILNTRSSTRKVGTQVIRNPFSSWPSGL